MSNDTATFARAYSTIDKTGWLRGPWDDEPDKAQWVDEATGLDCLIVRNGSGALCGYVGVPADHPWHQVGYSEHLDVPCSKRDSEGCWWEEGHTPESAIEVHGGLTYSDRCMENSPEDRGICHVPEPGRPDEVWWFGFDCAHAYDLSPEYAGRYRDVMPDEVYRDIGYVRGEVARLAAQLAEVAR